MANGIEIWNVPVEGCVRKPKSSSLHPASHICNCRLPQISANSRSALARSSTPHREPSCRAAIPDECRHRRGPVARSRTAQQRVADQEYIQQLTVAALERCFLSGGDYLKPLDLVRCSAVANHLGQAVAETCTYLLHQMSSTTISLPPDGSMHSATAERLLHRRYMQNQALCSKAVAAENYSAGVDKRGRLLIWGRPGWLEHTSSNSETKAFPPLWLTVAEVQCMEEAALRIHSLAASRHAVFALSTSGRVLYAVTVRDPYSLQVKAVQLRILKELEDVKVVQMATRFGQAYAVSDDGGVYAWGIKSGDPLRPEHTCSMGFGEICTQLHPRPIPGFGIGGTPIRFVAAGVSHALFVSVFGEVYSVGRNEHGKLGLGKGRSNSATVHQVLSPTKVRFTSGPTPSIISAAAGNSHSLFLANTGEVWGCGAVKDGALPLTTDSRVDRWLPKPLDKLPCFCSGIAAGASCSFFVGECGEVFYTGTALQTSSPFQRPTRCPPSHPWKIPGLRNVEYVVVSMELSYYQWEHAIFARSDGSLFGWGHNGHGEFVPRGGEVLSPAKSEARSTGSGSTLGFCNTAVLIENWPDARPRT